MLTCVPAMAEYTPEQRAFRSTVTDFLRNEGYAPTIDSDGDVAFKKEGAQYWIHIDGGGSESTSFYVEFHGPSLWLEDASKAISLMACNYVNNNKKCIKATLNSDNTRVLFTVELFCMEASDFTAVFYRYIDVLDAASDDVQKYYADHSND